MRHVRSAAGMILAVVVLSSPASARTWQEQSTKSVPAAGVHALRIDNPRGVVSVTRVPGTEIRLTALKTIRSNDAKWAERVSGATQVTAEDRGGEFRIRVIYPQRQAVRVRFWDLFSDFEWPRVEVRLALDVPDGIPVTLRSTSGDLVSDGVRSAQTIESTSGDISVAGAGPVLVNSTSGDVHVNGCEGLRVRTVSGDLVVEHALGALIGTTTSGNVRVKDAGDSIEVHSVSGDLDIDTAPRGLRAGSTSGDISVRRAAGRVRVESTSGTVDLGLDSATRQTSISTTNGDVKLHLLGGTGCAFDFATSNGEIQVIDVPMDIQNVTRHKLKAVVRQGTVPVTVRTASGDIRVSEGAR